ncbi:MAG: DUF5312 domain-containing protein [Treponema sp.]|jgi:hypothetical protein|nr:DUF5312 domain-containing protein [Treponema sp.]
MVIAFFEALRSFLLPHFDSLNTNQKRLLAMVTRDINRSRHRKWYRIRKQELTEEVGTFFYELYRLSAHAGFNMQNATESEQLKAISVEFHMDESLLALKERLSPQVITEHAANMPNEQLSIWVERDIARFNAAFDTAFIENADRYYNLILMFSQFVVFDFFTLLKQFDPLMSERDLNFQPKVRQISAKRVIELIKDFLEISYPLEGNHDWATMFNLANRYKENVGITLDEWKMILLQLSLIQSTSILVLIVRHVDHDPLWKSIPRIQRTHITDAYRAAVVDEAKTCLDDIIRGREQKQLVELLTTVFGPKEVGNRMHYYTPGEDETLRKNGLEGYTYVHELNYLKTFILDFYKKDIKELFDMCVLHGQWVQTNMNRQFTDSFHEVLANFEKFLEFDSSLSMEASLGAKLRSSLAKNKSQAPVILSAINDMAQELLESLTESLAGIELLLKSLFYDQSRRTNQLIRNWEALETIGAAPLRQRLADVYQKLSSFVKALHIFLHQVKRINEI